MCGRSGTSDRSDGCREFTWQKSFLSIFPHKSKVVRFLSVFYLRGNHGKEVIKIREDSLLSSHKKVISCK